MKKSTGKTTRFIKTQTRSTGTTAKSTTKGKKTMNKNTETTTTTKTRKPRKDKGIKRGEKTVGKNGVAPVVNGIKGIASVPAPKGTAKKADKAQAAVDRVNKKIGAAEGKVRTFCCCGCGQLLTAKRPKAFLQGHDARFVGIVKKMTDKNQLSAHLDSIEGITEKQVDIVTKLLAKKGLYL